MGGLICRVCGHGEVETLGQIPDFCEFAGQYLSPPIKGGELWLCKSCGSMFRHPTLSEREYIGLYEKAPGAVWTEGKEKRNDFATVYSYLETHPAGSVLDIGCYSGSFLRGLPDKFKKFGVEPSGMASKNAVSRGVVVLGKTLDDLDSGQIFDVVISIDVIEHVLDVEKFLNNALLHVREGGLLIISTGNPDCVFWKKVFRSKFWYSWYPEHLVFPSFRFFCAFAERHGLKQPEQIRFRYVNPNPLVKLVRLLRYLLTVLLQVYRMRLKNKSSSAFNLPTNPAGVFTDHHLIIFRKEKLG